MRTRGPRSTVYGVPNDGGRRGLPSMLPGLRNQNRKGAATAEQGTVQQAVRGCSGPGVRERGGAAGGAAVWSACQHGASDRFAVSGAVGSEPPQTGSGADGRR